MAALSGLASRARRENAPIIATHHTDSLRHSSSASWYSSVCRLSAKSPWQTSPTKGTASPAASRTSRPAPADLARNVPASTQPPSAAAAPGRNALPSESPLSASLAGSSSQCSPSSSLWLSSLLLRRQRHHIQAPTRMARTATPAPAPAMTPVLSLPLVALDPSPLLPGVLPPGESPPVDPPPASPEVLPVEADPTWSADRSPTEIPDDASAAFRFAAVVAAATVDACSFGTVTTVSTATDSASRRRRRPEDCCVTDAMATADGARDSECATPATYTTRLASSNASSVIASEAVKVIADAQSEHASHDPPSVRLNPAEQ